MQIVGGLYRELCHVPAWDAVFGSGVRAAAAVSVLSPGSTLHTYAEGFESLDATSLKEQGIEVRLSRRPTAIVFAYFHPLSRPHIQPPLDEITRQQTIEVSGDAVLRFGFLEGDAVINACRAVYDPQTWRDPAPFGANGSIADELAIVLNERELQSAAGLDDLSSAASRLMERQSAAVIVVKGGVRGAMVFERGGRAAYIPAYRSPRVFKIGTGDVFSAIFAHHWAEARLPAVDAADIASRSVAAYCGAVQLPLADNAHRNLVPVKSAAPGTVLIEGAADTIGQRYTMEEARFVLRELGVDVTSPALDGTVKTNAAAVLVLADGLGDETITQVQRAKAAGTPIVVLREGGVRATGVPIGGAGVTVTNDFASALYFAAWAAAERS
ncbi:PfkB family carbohydrate kinase [Paraburkholderia kururiensis]|uniref:Carbohydrate kinase family protein n=1 Tax=Paraburkholderia kururiensis TaxID=984307 RepID=A0ABZ0WDR1_9BURK|nr:carbohydrate kinase family protein [Paraburkholderia kururiensis]WQD75486.1 carbohydrate kinase family protein [Paraburkholderia kururiensis]